MLLSNFRRPCAEHLSWVIHLRGLFYNVLKGFKPEKKVWFGAGELPPYSEDWNSLTVDMSWCCRAWAAKVCAGLWCWQQRCLLSKSCVWHQEMSVFLLCKIPSCPQAASKDTGNLFLTDLWISGSRAKPWIGGNQYLHDQSNWCRLTGERRWDSLEVFLSSTVLPIADVNQFL